MSSAELAAQYGLEPSAARPSLPRYIAQLWARRYFITTYSSSRSVAQYSKSILGQLWQVVTPLMNAGVYLLIFGIILQTSRGIDNFIVFLVTGVFVFTYTQSSVNAGARAVSGNLALIRALHFPRATLPLSATLVQLRQLMVSMIVLCAIVLIVPVNLIGEKPMGSPEPVTMAWFLVVPALLLQTVFNIGISLAIARVGARVTDIQQLLPFALRVWMYSSGVIFSIPDRMGDRFPGWLIDVMMANPAAVYIEVMRDALMETHTAPAYSWPLAVAWAVVAFVAGFVYFWAAEEKYGRG